MFDFWGIQQERNARRDLAIAMQQAAARFHRLVELARGEGDLPNMIRFFEDGRAKASRAARQAMGVE